MNRNIVCIFAALLAFADPIDSNARQRQPQKSYRHRRHHKVKSNAARYMTAADSTHLNALRTGKPHLVWCTYYGKSSHGRRTASGEIHDMNAYVCAHLTLPFGTLIKVSNPQNGKEIVVKVNDRGPHRRKYKLDLSYGAARDLGFLRAGVAKLEITVLGK